MILNFILTLLLLQQPASDSSLKAPSWQGISLLSFGAAHLILFFDKPLDSWNRRQPSSAGYQIWKGAGKIGHYYDQLTPDGASVVAVASLVSLSVLSKREEHFETALLIVEAQVLTNLLSGMVKHLAGRVRPDVTEHARDFQPFTFMKVKRVIDITRGIYPSNSLVSGHTSGIFALAGVLTHQYKSLWVQLPAYTLATSVALNRVQKGKHWASDVLLGAVLGWGIGQEVARREIIWRKRVSLSLHLYHHEGVPGSGLKIHF
jgi:membrane-associated phospholipid phosphatase